MKTSKNLNQQTKELHHEKQQDSTNVPSCVLKFNYQYI